MSSINRSMSHIITAGSILFDNTASNPLILSKLSQFGYSETEMEAGKALFARITTLPSHIKNVEAEKMEQIRIFNLKRKEVGEIYQVHLKIARIVFKKDEGAIIKLGLKGTRSRVGTKWIAMAAQFYGNILRIPDYLERMGRFNISEENLRAGKDMIEELEDLREAKEAAKGTLKDEVRKMKEATLEWLEWESTFLKIAKIALVDNKYLIESLGEDYR